MEGRWKGYVHYTEFSTGGTVVYPHYGAAKIENIIGRELNGETVQYLVLQTLQSDLNIQVPAKNAELVDVRDVVDEEGLLKVFSILREIDVEEAGNWSRRYKANRKRLGSGDTDKVAEVVRDLWRRDQDRGLPAGEKCMLSKARQVLVGELALADGIGKVRVEEAFARVDATIECHRALVQEGAADEKKDEAGDKPVGLDADV